MIGTMDQARARRGVIFLVNLAFRFSRRDHRHGSCVSARAALAEVDVRAQDPKNRLAVARDDGSDRLPVCSPSAGLPWCKFGGYWLPSCQHISRSAAPTTGIFTFATAKCSRPCCRYTAKIFGRAILMPNLVPPVRTTEEGVAYRERVMAALPAGIALYAADDLLSHRRDRP